MASARTAGKLSPCTALAIEVRITVLVKTSVDRERHVATANGLRRNAAPAAHGGSEFPFLLDVCRGVTADTPEAAIWMSASADWTSASMYIRFVRIGEFGKFEKNARSSGA